MANIPVTLDRNKTVTLKYIYVPFWPTDTVARDGKYLRMQPQDIQNMFDTMWGAAAEVRWCYEHNVDLGYPARWPTETVAMDGQSLATQPQEIQDMFTGMWKAAAAVRWCYEHNVALGYPPPPPPSP